MEILFRGSFEEYHIGNGSPSQAAWNDLISLWHIDPSLPFRNKARLPSYHAE